MNGNPPQMLPAYEQLKVYVVSNLFDMTETYSEIQKNFFLKKFPRATVAGFKSQILKFYRFVRPKIKDYVNGGEETSNEGRNVNKEYYTKFMEVMDGYVDSPKKMKLEEAMAAFDFLLQFCEDSGLTKLTVQRFN